MNPGDTLIDCWFGRKLVYTLCILLACLVLLGGCGVSKQRRDLVTTEKARYLDRGSSFLKAHMVDGGVYVLSPWRVDETERVVLGKGTLLDSNRDTLAAGDFSIPLDSVAIFETNRVSASPAIIAMSLVTGISAALTTLCIMDPKACFGSCPTFYIEDGDERILQAEGFSSSVAPSLEASDIDALFRVKPMGREFEVIVKNEALETHVIRYVDLLTARRPRGGRVFATPEGRFWQVTRLIEPSRCQGPEGDNLEKLRVFDGNERISLTDPAFLGTKETIELEFDSLPDDRLGLIIASRQSLLSTFLFYQGLAYMGSSVGRWMAYLERGDEFVRNGIRAMDRALGGIEILVCDASGDCRSVSEISEAGPLATNTRVVPLPDWGEGLRKIRLRFTKGHWRIDYVAVAVLDREVNARTLHPVMVHHNSSLDSDAREILLDTSRVLVTLPGDVYKLTYRLPYVYQDYELFLKTRGYYLEWIRDEWLAEENAAKAATMFLDPEKALRELASKFKEIEAEMEEMFWRSRYAR